MARVLWSINERLCGGEGERVEPLSSDFLEDTIDVMIQRATKPEQSKPDADELEELFGI